MCIYDYNIKKINIIYIYNDYNIKKAILYYRTTSNYVKNTIPASNEITIPSPTLLIVPQNVKTPVAHRVITPIQIPSTNWTSHFYESSLSSMYIAYAE